MLGTYSDRSFRVRVTIMTNRKPIQQTQRSDHAYIGQRLGTKEAFVASEAEEEVFALDVASDDFALSSCFSLVTVMLFTRLRFEPVILT